MSATAIIWSAYKRVGSDSLARAAKDLLPTRSRPAKSFSAIASHRKASALVVALLLLLPPPVVVVKNGSSIYFYFWKNANFFSSDGLSAEYKVGECIFGWTRKDTSLLKEIIRNLGVLS